MPSYQFINISVVPWYVCTSHLLNLFDKILQLYFLCLETANDVCPWLLTGLINVVSPITYSTLYICNHIFFLLKCNYTIYATLPYLFLFFWFFLLKCNYIRYATIFFFSLESFQMQLWWTLHNVNNQRQLYH